LFDRAAGFLPPGPEGVDGLAGWVMAWQLARRQAWSVSLFDLEAVSSFSNRRH